jgi:hypothetical protein
MRTSGDTLRIWVTLDTSLTCQETEMTYAGERLINDADSHLMELPDFLTAHADASIREQLPNLLDALTGQFDPQSYAGVTGHAPEDQSGTLRSVPSTQRRGRRRLICLGFKDRLYFLLSVPG